MRIKNYEKDNMMEFLDNGLSVSKIKIGNRYVAYIFQNRILCAANGFSNPADRDAWVLEQSRFILNNTIEEEKLEKPEENSEITMEDNPLLGF